MQPESSRPILSAIFVDYDNIYLSLKRKSEDAAKRFAKDAASWMKRLETGALITPTNSAMDVASRRLVMNRCYGNPVPRRNQSDNSTDMNSFPFVRHHFLRSGFEIVDCPPLTAQLKNSSDIRMVMDIRDYLDHKTNFDEFIILSSDADFTPVLHRLRSHAKRTVIFANDHTAAPYTALSDGEVREADLLALLLGEEKSAETPVAIKAAPDPAEARAKIIADVTKTVLDAPAPQPLEALADQAIRTLGKDLTIGSDWGGAGSFRELLLLALPETVRITEQAPYFAYDVSRVVQSAPRPALPDPNATLKSADPAAFQAQAAAPQKPAPTPQHEKPNSRHETQSAPEAAASAPNTEVIHQQIARIHEACQAPPISPPEYSALFNVLAAEINENQLQGVKTLENVVARARDLGIDITQDDARFVLDVVSETDPWFENGASPKLFAGRFRNFVVARCRSQGLNLSADELDLIDAWFAGGPSRSDANAQTASEGKLAATTPEPSQATSKAAEVSTPSYGATQVQTAEPRQANWPGAIYGETPAPGNAYAPTSYQLAGAPDSPAGQSPEMDDFPRIVRNRLRG